MNHKPVKTKRNKRKGGSLDHPRTKGQHKHKRHISKLFRSGDVSSGQEVPHEVLMDHANRYMPSEPGSKEDKPISWNMLPPEVVKELHGNIPTIKDILKKSVIKPTENEISKEELLLIRERSYINRPHVVAALDIHHTMPANIKSPDVYVNILSECIECECGDEYATKHARRYSNSSELLNEIKLTVLSTDINAYTLFMGFVNRQGCRLNDYWTGRSYEDFVSCICENTGCSEVDRNPKIYNICDDDTQKTTIPISHRQRMRKEISFKPNKHMRKPNEISLNVCSTFKLDIYGRYYVTTSTVCTLEYKIQKTGKEWNVDTYLKMSSIETGSAAINFMFHNCSCK